MKNVQDGVGRKYWLEDGIFYVKCARLFVPKGGRLQ